MLTEKELNLTQLSATNKDYYRIWEELLDLARKISDKWDPTTTNESDPGIVLLKVLTALGDKLNYTIDVNTLEAFMPSAAQTESMRKLCAMMGYSMKYYQSATTDVTITYNGETDISTTLLELPAFSCITNSDKDINYFTTETRNFSQGLLSQTVPCIEGQLCVAKSTSGELITADQLDDNNKFYLPETQVAENGIFIYNYSDTAKSERWQATNLLHTEPLKSKVYQFGFDSIAGRPYIQFPSDINQIMGDGLSISYVRTSGVNGNISAQTLSSLVQAPQASEGEVSVSAEDFTVINLSAATNGANPESLDSAYTNFKKTVGVFNTLVTCRDYMNKIYTLMDSTNIPLVSNVIVSDIRNDINRAVTISSYNDYGLCYLEKSMQADNENKISHFDLVLYPFKTYRNLKAKNDYINSFKYTDSNNNLIKKSLEELKTISHTFVSPTNDEVVAIKNYLKLDAKITTTYKVNAIEAADILVKVKTAIFENFNLRQIDIGEEIPFDLIYSVISKADHRIKHVSLAEPTLYTKFALANGREYDLVTPEVNIWTESDENNQPVEKATITWPGRDIYNKLALRNIIAGRLALFNYQKDFKREFDEVKYEAILVLSDDQKTALKELVTTNSDYSEIKTFESTEAADAFKEEKEKELLAQAKSNFDNEVAIKIKSLTAVTSNASTEIEWTINSTESDEGSITVDLKATTTTKFNDEPEVTGSYDLITSNESDKKLVSISASCRIPTDTEYTLKANESVKFRYPSLLTTETYPAYVNYYLKLNNGEAKKAIPATVQTITNALVNGLGTDIKIFNKENAKEITNLVGELNTYLKTKVSGLEEETLKDANDNPLKDNSDNPTEIKVYGLSNSSTWVHIISFFNNLKIVDLNTKIITETVNVYKQSATSSAIAGGYLATDSIKYSAVTQMRNPAVGKNILNYYYLPIYHGLESTNYTYTRDGLGANAILNYIPANTEYQLKDGDELYINYTQSNSTDGSNTNSTVVNIVYTKDYVDPRSGLTKNIIKPNFDMYDSEALQNQKKTTLKWAKTSGFDFTNKGGSINKPAGMFSFAASEQVEIRAINKITLNKPCNLYWEFKDCEKVNDALTNKDEIEPSYTLQEGEYLFYTDTNRQEMTYYGKGNRITLSGSTSIFFDSIEDNIDLESILENGITAVPWKFKMLNEQLYLTITEFQYQTLAEGTKINGIIKKSSTDITNYLENKWEPIENAWWNDDTSLPNLDIEGFELEGRSIYTINFNSEKAQELSTNNFITLKYETSTQTEPAKQVFTALKEEQPLFLKSNYECYSNSDDISLENLTEFKIRATSKTPFAVNGSSGGNSLEKNNIDDSHTIITFANTNMTKNDYIPVTVTIEPDTFGILMLYYMVPSTLNIEKTSHAHFQINTSDAIQLLTAEDNEDWWADLKDDKNNYYLNPGLNIIKVAETTTFKFFADEDKKSQLVIGTPVLVNANEPLNKLIDYADEELSNAAMWRIADSSEIASSLNTNNNVYPYEIILRPIAYSNNTYCKYYKANTFTKSAYDEAASYVEFLIRKENSTEPATNADLGIASLNKLKDMLGSNLNLYYFTCPIDKSLEIDLNENLLNTEDAELLSNPSSWYEANNINNNFVISEIDADFLDVGVTIARTSRKN